MARKTSNFMIGLFVTIGVIIAVVAVIWFSASKYFEKGYYYVTYFDESVQGLQVDSYVKYRGITIGKVDKIWVAPDGRLIEVVMKITVKPEVEGGERELVTQLKAAGITGIVFVELDKKDLGAPDLSPKLDFEPPYKVIDSKPSNIKQLFDAVDGILQQMDRLDFEGISDQLKLSLASIETTLSGEKVNNILASLESVSKNLDTMIARTEEATRDAPVESVLFEAKEALVDIRKLINNANEKISSLKLEQTTDKANKFVDDLHRNTNAIGLDFKETSNNLRRATESLEMLLQRLEASPSDIIFSTPAPPRRAQEEEIR